MCGIVGAVARRDIPNILLEGLKRLEYRGYDSAGLAVIGTDDQQLQRRRVLGKVKGLVDSLAAAPLRGRTGIAHTRWATHGVPSEANAHPHASDEVMLVHNGIIENHHDLRRELVALGYEFTSETDSEVIVHLINETLKHSDNLLDAVRTAVKRLDGAFALGVIHRSEPDAIIAARKGSPLVVGLGFGENFIASDALALRAVTDRFIFLEEGDLVRVSADAIDIWDLDDATVVRSSVKVDGGLEDIDKGKYRHHMEKEIYEQPSVVRATLEGRVGRHQVLEEALGVNAKKVLDETKAVTIVACGTSYYAASVARYWIEELTDLPCNVEIASEFRYRKSARLPNSLFVTISQSGETADTLAALREAKKLGYENTLTICNVPSSSLARESDVALMIQAGPEIGVASTKAFVGMLVDLLLLTIMLARRNGLSPEVERELVDGLHALPGVLARTLKLDPEIRRLSSRFIEKNHALFLGRGSMYPIAMEGALKLKELSYIHAEGYPAGELKHGPLALVDSEMPVIAVAPNNDLLEKLQSNLEEVRARGGEVFVFTDETSDFESDPSVRVINVPTSHELLAPIVFTIPLQLLSYHTAVMKGTDVDQPRNLAKSVTVE